MTNFDFQVTLLAVLVYTHAHAHMTSINDIYVLIKMSILSRIKYSTGSRDPMMKCYRLKLLCRTQLPGSSLARAAQPFVTLWSHLAPKFSSARNPSRLIFK